MLTNVKKNGNDGVGNQPKNGRSWCAFHRTKIEKANQISLYFIRATKESFNARFALHVKKNTLSCLKPPLSQQLPQKSAAR